MTYLKRASKEIEDRILKKTQEVNSQFSVPTDEDLKVYLRLQNDGSIQLTKTGQVGMTLMSDREILSRITSGEMFSIADEI